jgi:hypothetical protein
MATLNITELDFDKIKTNIKTFLNTTSEFKDYDFEGSNLSTMIDILAYNTYYNGYYLNMVSNEMFLDSAILRESILSRAKELNYLPGSANAARATVNLAITAAGGAASITIPKGTVFTSTVGDQTYTFATIKAFTALPNGGIYIATNVQLLEGELLSYTFEAHNENTPIRYVIPNDNVDINNISVTVQTSASDNTTSPYVKADTVFNLDSTSQIYFIQPFAGNQYEIVFGDGNFGKKLVTGNIVSVGYCATDGDRPNGASDFTYVSGIAGASAVTVTTVSAAAGGSFEESLESIRFNATRHYSTQYRAVTANDFKTIIEQKFPTFVSVRAYGGEDIDPPQYGTVKIAIRPEIGEVLTDVRKQEVLAYLKDRSVLSIQPEIVDPNYIYLNLNYVINYDPDKTTKSGQDLAALVTQEILDFGATNLGQFNASLRASKLAAQIDNLDRSIIGSGGSFTLRKRLFPSLNTDQSFLIQLNNSILRTDANHERHAGHIASVFSSAITFQGEPSFFKDDGNGVLYIYSTNPDGTERTLDPNIGTVDYTTGTITINRLNISQYQGAYLTVSARPATFDVVPKNNQILLIQSSDIITTAIPEQNVANV